MLHSITISSALFTQVVLAALVIGVLMSHIYLRNRQKGLEEAFARSLGLEGDRTARHDVSSQDEPKSKKGISKWKVALALVAAALIGLIFLPKDDESGAPKHRGKIVAAETVKASASAADKEEAPAAKNDACGKCKVEKIPNEELTTKKVGKEWKFLGHKCVGGSGCDACEVDNCTGDDNTSPPTGPCDHCSKVQ